DRTLGDEHFGAPDDPRLAFATRRGLQGSRVRPRAGLGQRPRRQPLPRSGLGEILAFLLFRAEGEDVTGAQPVVTRHRERQGPIHTAALFDRDGVGQHVHARTTESFWNANAKEPELRKFWHELLRKSLFGVPGLGLRSHFTLAEFAHRGAQDSMGLW